MALLRTQIVRKVQNQTGSAIANANATIYSLPDNSLATVYTNETGTATYTQPLQSGLDGSFAGWLELGDYSITIASSAGTSTSRYYANHPQQSYLETYGDDVPLTVKAGTALTSNMAEWKDSSGTTVMSVSTAGSITSPTITAIQGSVNNTQGSVVAVNSSLGSALGTIGTNTAAIGSVSGTVGTAVTNISNINSSLGSALGTISTNTAAIGSVAGTVSTNTTAITNLQGTVTNIVTQPFGTVNANYTIGTADANKLIKTTSATAITITLPPNGSVAFPVGQGIDVVQMAAGSVTFGTATAGTAGTVTILSTPSLILRTQYSGARITKTDTNEWLIIGDMF